MADTKISDLTSAGALTGDEVVPIVQSGGNAKLALSALLTWITAALSTALRLIPAGGGTGQYLRKTSIDDYETEWSSAGLVPDSSVAGYVLTQLSGTAGDYAFASPALTPAAGSGGQIQYNDGANSFAGAALAGIGTSGSLEQALDTAPPVPGADKLTSYATKIGGRMMPAFRAPRGAALPLQASLPHTRHGYWAVTGGTALTPVGVGLPNSTQGNGPGVGRTPTSANLLSAMRRVGNRSAATAGSSAGFRSNILLFFRETTNMWGGFYCVFRFGEADIVTDSRAFCGVIADANLIANVNPSTLLSVIGMAYDSGETNWRIIHNDTSGTATKIDLGADYPCNTSDTAYEITIWAPAGQSSVWVEVWRMGTAHRVTHEITSDLPASGTLLAPQLWVNNGATAAAKTVDISSLWVETDY